MTADGKMLGIDVPSQILFRTLPQADETREAASIVELDEHSGDVLVLQKLQTIAEEGRVPLVAHDQAVETILECIRLHPLAVAETKILLHDYLREASASLAEAWRQEAMRDEAALAHSNEEAAS